MKQSLAVALSAQIAVLMSRQTALEQLILKALETTQPPLDGLKPRTWLEREVAAQREKLLLKLEDENPAFAAQVQQFFDASKQRKKKP